MTNGESQIGGYQLLDFGHGRKLEQFGELILDRPSPAAEGIAKDSPKQWRDADVVLDAKGILKTQTPRSTEFLEGKRPWIVTWNTIKLQLRLTPFGHVGVFPEQLENWALLTGLIRNRVSDSSSVAALNLFAYTGGSTLAMASAGANTVHVDASGPAVNWARRNCDASELSQFPIRWIQEDARKFVARERKRQNKYEFVVLDPPSFGHGPKGKRWDITEDLAPLLGDIAAIMSEESCHIILSGHSTTPSADDILRLLGNEIRRAGRAVSTNQKSLARLNLVSSSGRPLDAGYSIHLEVAPL
ncbi:MAG: class I SAM-dependent methyltransferase [Aureliella sp.]